MVVVVVVVLLLRQLQQQDAPMYSRRGSVQEQMAPGQTKEEKETTSFHISLDWLP